MPTPPTAQIDSRRGQRGDPALLRALAEPAMYGAHLPVAVHETHASWVFVAGERAYKIKKPLALGFLDYSTLERRRDACREEVRVNRELAPGLYLGVRAIVETEQGFRLARDGAPGAVEYAVEMQSFRDEDTFAGLIASSSLTRTHVAEVARVLADFHRSAEVVADWGPGRMLAAWRKNVCELQADSHPPEWRLDVAASFGEAFVKAHAPELSRRAQMGLARDGHGDLRCEHVLGRPSIRIVDRIEFDPQLRRTDIAGDLAFLAMDLEALGQRWAARELIDAYRQTGLDPGGEAQCHNSAGRPLRGAARTRSAAGGAAPARPKTLLRRDTANRRRTVPRVRGARGATRRELAETRCEPEPRQSGGRARASGRPRRAGIGGGPQHARCPKRSPREQDPRPS